MRVSGPPCPFCKHTHQVTVSPIRYWAWQQGHLLIQQVTRNRQDAEILMTGIDPACWDREIGDEPT